VNQRDDTACAAGRGFTMVGPPRRAQPRRLRTRTVGRVVAAVGRGGGVGGERAAAQGLFPDTGAAGRPAITKLG
jgi:hypothetical protein